MENFKGHSGYVRAVFSGRVNGFALPLDLVRAHCGAVAKVAKVAMRRRLGRAFADYLVTDGEPAFSEGRAWYEVGIEPIFVTGARWPFDVERKEGGGPLDAPSFMPAGACAALGSGGGAALDVERGFMQYVTAAQRAAAVAIFEQARDGFAAARGKHRRGPDFLCLTGCGFVGFGEAIDAPDFVAAGSFKCWENDAGEEIRAPEIVSRGGVWE